MDRLDVVVIGAGASGLAAAGALRRAGARIALVEARRRIGGRVFTRHDRRAPLPIELGAEFVHGGAPDTVRLLRAAGLVASDTAGDHWRAEHGVLRRAVFGSGIDRVLRRIDRDAPDESFASFLARRPGGRPLAEARTAAAAFVQGFHAADLERVSAHFVAPEDEDPDEGPSRTAGRSGRVAAGYGRLMDWMAHAAGPVRFGAMIERITWRRGRVDVEGRAAGRRVRVRAKAAIITVPIGVLQARPGSRGAIVFDPDPPRMRAAIDRLGMGHAVRVVFAFDEFPWMRARDGASFGDIGFLHTPGNPFNVWWTLAPQRAPMAVAWSGGPPAAALSRLGPTRIRAAAIATLARALGRSRRAIESRVAGSWMHDWTRDPFSRGAYTYTCVGGIGAPAVLARPIDRTLVIAGEHTDAEAMGTVEAAIASGLRAAKQVKRALG